MLFASSSTSLRRTLSKHLVIIGEGWPPLIIFLLTLWAESWFFGTLLTVALTKTYQSNQLIHFDASFTSSNSCFTLSMVYAANEIGMRRSLWDDLSGLQPHQPWIVMGDFNCTRNASKKLGSTIQNAMAMSDLNDFIDATSL